MQMSILNIIGKEMNNNVCGMKINMKYDEGKNMIV